MDAVKSLRLPENLLRSARYLARRERLDESTAIRQLIALGTAEYAVRLYREGKITLNEASELASVTPREMIEILLDHGLKGNVTVRQARKALEIRSGCPRPPEQDNPFMSATWMVHDPDRAKHIYPHMDIVIHK